MPANPGAKRATEKKNRKRAAAQLARKQATQRASARATPSDESVDVAIGTAADGPFGARRPDDFDDLDRLAGELKEAMKARKIDLAERKAAEMVRRFPGEPDGWQGFSAVAEARGDLPRALAEMERAAERAPADDVGTTRAIEKQLARLRTAADRAR